MTQHILPFDQSVVPQQYAWDCGPASAQVVLNSLGIIKSEDELVSLIGTTVNGTDSIDQVTKALQALVPAAEYTTVAMPSDPPTQAQQDALWANVVQSIDAGYGLVMNWVAPASNYPVGVDGSPSPDYSGGTVYHYVPCMGYNDADRALYIADPGFAPYCYWVSFDQCASLIPPKGYTYGAAGQAPAATDPTTDDSAVQVLVAAVPSLTTATATALLPNISDGLVQSQCTTVNRIAMWLAQIGEESAGFTATVEIGDLDGTTYQGRTWIQITGQDNYAAFSQWAYGQKLPGVTSETFFVDNPAALGDAQYEALGPAWYWTVARPQINSLCDAGDVTGVTEAINGGTNGLENRTNRWNQALAVGDALLTLVGDDLFTDDDRNLLNQISGIFRPSLSPFRHVGEGNVNTCAGFAWSADGNVHAGLVSYLAIEVGDPQSIALLYEVASTTDTTRTADAALAKLVLEKVAPATLALVNSQIVAWLDAEKAAGA